MLRVGVHAHRKDFLEDHEALEESTVIQVFLRGPYGNASELISIPASYRRVYAHAPYTLNMCQEGSGERLLRELNDAATLGVKGYVVHVGRRGSIAAFEKNLMYALKKRSCDQLKLLIETPAGQGTELCTTPEELSSVVNRIGRGTEICLDTCHVYAAGYLPSQYVGRVRAPVGLIHLNDSAVKLGMRVDRHENLGKGFLPKDELRWVVTFAHQYTLPMILETPDRSYQRKELKWMIHEVKRLSK